MDKRKNERKNRRRLIILGVLITLILLLLIGGVLAFFTDIVPVNLFSTTGILDIEFTTPSRVIRHHIVGENEYYEERN